VRQQNSGAVEDFILPYSAVYLRIQKWRNYWNRSTFAKVIVKIKVAPFLMAHGVVLRDGFCGTDFVSICTVLLSFVSFLLVFTMLFNNHKSYISSELLPMNARNSNNYGHW